MRSISRTIVAIVGLLVMLAGIGLFVDGVLPTRSHGPNPSVFEIAVGVVMGVAGFFVRRQAHRRAVREHTVERVEPK